MFAEPARRKTLPQYLPQNEVEMLLDAPYKNNIRDRLILRLMVCSGMRASEVCNLQRKDVFLGEYKIIVRQGKGGVDRLVPLVNKASLEIMTNYLTAGGFDPEDRIFDITRQGIYGLVKRYAERSGIKHPVHPHMLRHSFAVYSIKAGMDIRALQKAMGHKRITTTTVYLLLTGEDVIDAARNHPLPF